MFNIPQPWSAIIFWSTFALLPGCMLYYSIVSPARRRRQHRIRAGLCLACGYDRAGLAAGSVCPECGKQPEAR